MTFKNKVVAGFGTGLAILLVVAVLAYRSMLRNDVDLQWVNHTYQVQGQVDAVVADLLSAEAGERGFILTGEVSFLDPYNDAVSRINGDVNTIRRVTSDNPVQQRALDRLEPSIAERVDQLRYRVGLRKQEGMVTDANIALLLPGKENMDMIRGQLAAMREEENRLLNIRTQEASSSSRQTRNVIVTGEALAIAFLSIAGIVVGEEMARRGRAEQEIRALNADLEQRVAERTVELDARAKDLARSNSELQQFAYVASHDLQEPLRMVASFTQLLGKRYKDRLDDDARDFINFAVDGATRMQTLISDLLNYSRVGTQGKPLVPTDSGVLFERVLDTLQLSIQESGGVITSDPLPMVMADPQQLGQLFQNLLTNAIKFHGEQPPRVRISAERDGGTWKFSFRDNGIGISQEHADRIFIIFQRLHTKTEYPGTGIGLAICKKIVERHGGRIWIEPSPGGGTTFNFTIIAAENPTKEGERNELRTPVHAG
jgi:signal transduction histidine kinase